MRQLLTALLGAGLLLGGPLAARAIDLGPLQIAPERIPEWNPGVEGGIPDTRDPVRWPVFRTLAAGASVDEIQAAIDGAAAAFGDGRQGSVVLLSPGAYNLERRRCLKLRSNVVLRGAGPESTVVTGDEGCIHETNEYSDYGIVHISGNSARWHDPDSERIRVRNGSLPRGTRTLNLADASTLAVGDWIRLSVDNDPAIIEDQRARNVLLHMARIVARSGNQITLDRGLRTDFNTAYSPVVLEIYPIRNAGVESFKLQNARPANNVDRGLLSFKFATNSWARDMVFYRGIKDMVGFESSARNTVTDSHIEYMLWHDCKVEGTFIGGVPDNCTGNEHLVNAYALSLERGAQDNLVTNNVFKDLYIMLIVARGATGNVFSYNYAVGTRHGSHGLFFHGHYPYENLLEGNDMEGSITIDEWWGRQGPRNTAFRNRLRHPSHRSRFANESGGPFAGFVADQFQAIGNVAWSAYGTPCSDSNYEGGYCFDFDGGHAGGSALTTRMWLERNLFRDARGPRWGLILRDPQSTTRSLENATGERAPASWSGLRLPASLYLTSRPLFWPASKPWPITGADVDDMSGQLGRLPAQDRYEGRTPEVGSGGRSDVTPPAAPRLLE